MRKSVVALLRRYVAAVHPEATGRKEHLKKAKAYWSRLSAEARGQHRVKLEAIIAKRFK